MAKQPAITEITIVRGTKVKGRVLRVGQVVPVANLEKGEVALLLNLGKARPTVEADKKRPAKDDDKDKK